MPTYCYMNVFVFNAVNYSDAKRIIESRFNGPMNPFQLEIKMPCGNFVNAAF